MAELKINGVGTIEEIRAAYYNQNALRQPNYRLCQVNIHGQRFYYNLIGDKREAYPSVTTIIKKVMPENTFLTSWRINLGKEASEAYTLDRARFGSFVHGQLQSLLITRKYNLDNLAEEMAKYADRERLPISFVESHIDEAKYDMLSFAKWIKDYDVQPLSVEIALYHPELKYAGMLDTICSMRKYPIGDKGGDERVVAICDFKTTTKEFRDEHAIQLGLYRDMWNIWFPDVPVTEIANISPKEWWNTAKKAVSYNFEWQTENEVLKQIPHLLALYKLLPSETKKFAVCSGTIDVDGDISSNVSILTIDDIVEQNRDKMLGSEAPAEEEPLFKE